jgi:hypothetical protein
MGNDKGSRQSCGNSTTNSPEKPRLTCHISTTPIDQDTGGIYDPSGKVQRPSASPPTPERKRMAHLVDYIRDSLHGDSVGDGLVLTLE